MWCSKQQRSEPERTAAPPIAAVGALPELSGDFSALVPEAFHDIMAEKGGCVIPDTAQRAVSLDQLKLVVKGHVEVRLLGQVVSITASDQEV